MTKYKLVEIQTGDTATLIKIKKYDSKKKMWVVHRIWDLEDCWEEDVDLIWCDVMRVWVKLVGKENEIVLDEVEVK